MKPTISFVFLLLFVSSITIASPRKRHRRIPNWNITGTVGTTLFYGDIKQNTVLPIIKFMNEVRVSGSVIVSRRLTNYLYLRGQVMVGQLAGTKRILQKSDSYFKSNMLDNNINLKLNIPELIKPGTYKLSCYLFAGVGFMRYRSIRRGIWKSGGVNVLYDVTGYDMDLNKTKAAIARIIPVGFGFDYLLNKKVSLKFEYSMRFTNTDRIDACTLDPQKDKYDYLSFGLTYYFKGNVTAPHSRRLYSYKKHNKHHPHYEN